MSLIVIIHKNLTLKATAHPYSGHRFETACGEFTHDLCNDKPDIRWGEHHLLNNPEDISNFTIPSNINLRWWLSWHSNPHVKTYEKYPLRSIFSVFSTCSRSAGQWTPVPPSPFICKSLGYIRQRGFNIGLWGFPHPADWKWSSSTHGIRDVIHAPIVIVAEMSQICPRFWSATVIATIIPDPERYEEHNLDSTTSIVKLHIGEFQPGASVLRLSQSSCPR